jgi:sugar lactone lactonase YvrE
LAPFKLVLFVSFLVLSPLALAAKSELYRSDWLTPENGFTSGIEGPSVDAAGFVFAMNYQKNGTIGKFAADGSTSEVFLQLPAGSRGNGSRFDVSGRMFIADYKNHNVLVVEKGENQAHVFFHSDEFHQPNDLAIAKNGTLFASDPDWRGKTGRIWRINGDRRGEIIHAPRQMGTANGLDLSPDEKTIYVSESVKREIWAYDLSPSGDLTRARLFAKFKDASIDGLRTDIDGHVFVARIEKPVIAELGVSGELIREIKLKGSEPSNLAFGGIDGRTVYVTQIKGRRLESFRVARPGREWCLVHLGAQDCNVINLINVIKYAH